MANFKYQNKIAQNYFSVYSIRTNRTRYRSTKHSKLTTDKLATLLAVKYIQTWPRYVRSCITENQLISPCLIMLCERIVLFCCFLNSIQLDGRNEGHVTGPGVMYSCYRCIDAESGWGNYSFEKIAMTITGCSLS